MAVCKDLNFTRASERLFISQPSLSQQIKSLEEELGIPLFDRIGKKTAITEAGQILLTHCYRIFHEIEQAKAALNDLNGLQRGKLQIGTILTEETTLLTPAILQYKKLYPNINLTVLGLPTENIIERLVENELDFGILFLPMEHEEFETISLFSEEFYLFAPKNHPIAKQEVVDFIQLEDVPMILLPEDFYIRKLIQKISGEKDVNIHPLLEMSSITSIIDLVTEGLGATILPFPFITTINNNEIKRINFIN